MSPDLKIEQRHALLFKNEITFYEKDLFNHLIERAVMVNTKTTQTRVIVKVGKVSEVTLGFRRESFYEGARPNERYY